MRRLGRQIGLPLLLVFLLPVPGLAEPDRKIALTFDDLPVLGPVGYWRPREISNMILRTLKAQDIPAAGFVVEERIQDDLSTFVVLEDWADAGHIVGNNTFAHVDLHQLKANEFLEHVGDGQKYLKLLSRSRRGFNYRYLRFPYLHQGDNEKKKNRVAKALYRASYEIAPGHHQDRRPPVQPDLSRRRERRPCQGKAQGHLPGARGRGGRLRRGPVPGRVRPEHPPYPLAPLRHRHRQFPGRHDSRCSRNGGYSFISMAEALEDPAFKDSRDLCGTPGAELHRPGGRHPRTSLRCGARRDPGERDRRPAPAGALTQGAHPCRDSWKPAPALSRLRSSPSSVIRPTTRSVSWRVSGRIGRLTSPTSNPRCRSSTLAAERVDPLIPSRTSIMAQARPLELPGPAQVTRVEGLVDSDEELRHEVVGQTDPAVGAHDQTRKEDFVIPGIDQQVRSEQADLPHQEVVVVAELDPLDRGQPEQFGHQAHRHPGMGGRGNVVGR